MERTWVKVLVVIVVLAIGMLLGMYLMAKYQAVTVRTHPVVPCTITYTDPVGSEPDAWAVEPFRTWPIEYGIYYSEPSDARTRDDTEL